MVAIHGVQRPVLISNDTLNYKNVLHILFKKNDFMTPSSYMFEQLSWLSIPKRFMYNKAVFTYKALYNLTPAYISYLLRPISKTHSRSLRSTENGLLSIPRSQSALFDRSFSPLCCKAMEHSAAEH